MSKRVNFSLFWTVVIFSIISLSLILFTYFPAHPSGKKIVLLPLALYADKPLDHIRKGVASMLASRLSGGGLEVIKDERVEDYVSEKEKQGITSKNRAEELAKIFEADCAIFGSITAIGGGYSLDLSLLELGKEGSSLTSISRAMSEDQFISELSSVANQLRAAIEGKEIAANEKSKPAPLPKASPARDIFSNLEHEKKEPSDKEKGIAFQPTMESKPFTPTGKIPLTIDVMSLDMGDLDGDGKVELVALDRKKLLVYQREGNSFVLIDTHNASWGEEFFKVSIGDMDNNKRAEMYVVSSYGTRARTTVFERAGEFKRLNRQIGHLQVVKDPVEDKSILLFQDSKVKEFFSGPIYRMDYGEKGKLIKSNPLPKMRGAQFYTLLLFDLDNDGNPEWLGLGEPNLNEQSGLHVWNAKGELLWQGDTHLGGTNNAIRNEEAQIEDLPPRIPFNSRLVVIDIDGDGSRDVLVIENIPMIEHLLDFKVYVRSKLIGYRTQGTTLVPGWTTDEIDYCVTDMQAYDHMLFLAAQKGKVSNMIGKKTGVIMWFE
jgi:hypothetical protein